MSTPFPRKELDFTQTEDKSLRNLKISSNIKGEKKKREIGDKQEYEKKLEAASKVIENNLWIRKDENVTKNMEIEEKGNEIRTTEKVYTNIHEEINQLNPIELFTPNEIFDSIQIFDSTVEVVGYVDNIESPRIVGNNQQYKVFKFYLNNGLGRRVQVVAWNDEVEKTVSLIMPNYIIHLDGVQARMPKISTFNNGNVQYELLIRNNTSISNLGKYEPNQTLEKPTSVTISEVLNVSGNIILQGYLKSNFAELYDNKLNKMIGYGSITDGTYKLEIHIMNYNHNDYCLLNILKGNKIEVIGIMQTAVNPIYLMVNDVKNIKKIDGFMSIKDLLLGTQLPNKRKSEESSQKQNKRNTI